ncbi:hypothetical protein VQ643_15815 [Pseudomonas sp. F1_0610]|uniref:hypothetical protein n=1 Tax=Pseudomonas sp. F1_0610 TaxID=3114284 RepID=UPI0039C093ED
MDSDGLLFAPWCSIWEIPLDRCPEVGEDIKLEDFPKEWINNKSKKLGNKPCDEVGRACKSVLGTGCYDAVSSVSNNRLGNQTVGEISLRALNPVYGAYGGYKDIKAIWGSSDDTTEKRNCGANATANGCSGSIPTSPDIMYAKGGKQNIANEYSREALVLAKEKGIDPCDYLIELERRTRSGIERKKYKKLEKH